jgi:hypothetical protein
MSARRPAPWLVATLLVVIVALVCFSMPFIVHWAWPTLDSGVLMIGNMFFGMVFGTGAAIGFLWWKWEL